VCVDHGADPIQPPDWFVALETGIEQDGALAVLAIVEAMEQARSHHGPMVADVM